jgi:hypothetical protein
MADVLLYLLAATCLAAAVVVGALFVRGPLSGLSLLAPFGARAKGRLDIVEQVNVDGRRRLVLIRRDDVEHLVMTGGPADVVIETGIASKRGGEVREAPAMFTRRPLLLGQAAGDR